MVIIIECVISSEGIILVLSLLNYVIGVDCGVFMLFFFKSFLVVLFFITRF